MDESYAALKAAFYSSDDWRRLRYRILTFHGRRCQCCGATADQGATIQVDHIIPLSVDWSSRLDRDNLQVLCLDCNLGKSNKSQEDFRPPVTPVTDSGPYLPIAITPPCPARYKGGPKIDRAASLSKLKLCKPYFWMTNKIAQRLGLASWTREQLRLAGLPADKTKGWIKEMIGRKYLAVVFENAFCARN